MSEGGREAREVAACDVRQAAGGRGDGARRKRERYTSSSAMRALARSSALALASSSARLLAAAASSSAALAPALTSAPASLPPAGAVPGRCHPQPPLPPPLSPPAAPWAGLSGARPPLPLSASCAVPGRPVEQDSHVLSLKSRSLCVCRSEGGAKKGSGARKGGDKSGGQSHARKATQSHA